MAAKGLHVVFGAGGGLGSAVIAALAEQGAQVRAVNRRGAAEVPEGVEVVQGNGADPESARAVCAGAAVVYHCANPPYNTWKDTIAPLMHGILAGAMSADALLVYGDNLYSYPPTDGPIHEGLPQSPVTRKGRIRAAISEELLAAHASGQVRAVIGRGSDFFGPFANSSGDLLFRPALEGKQAKALGNIDLPHTWSFTGDIGRGLVRLAEEESAWGQVWHIPSAPTVTTREFAKMVYEEAGTADRFSIMTAGRVIVALMGLFDPIMYEVREMMYEWVAPYTVDHSKYEKAFGNESTPHREAIKKTLEWYRNRPA